MLIHNYRISFCCFDQGPGVSPSGWYRPEPEGGEQIPTEGRYQGRDQNNTVMLFYI